ncbi:MAG: thioredoxin family protein [Burkholderiales bacterium]|nr:thioredoxin family protein [Burkholderiales bacterium]
MQTNLVPPARLVLAPLMLALAAALPLGAAAAAPVASKAGIAWQVASTDAEVDKAFALAKQTGRPVFLYWGAVWCPPCNQVKATLFSRADFVERSRAFVPVYVDGDKPGAQKVASRFKVSGYPTMILFKPDGSEVTRLPGEVDPERYLLTLTTALDAQVPVKELLQRGLSKQALTPEQWRLLAFYSWDTDEQQVLKTSELPKKLTELAAAVPADQAAVRDRLALKAVIARSREKTPDAAMLESDRKFADRLLADAAASREVGDLLTGYAEKLVKYLAPEGAARTALAGKWDAMVARRLEGSDLTRVDQLDALDSRVSMWKVVDGDKLSAAHRDQMLRDVAKVVAQTTDRYERQAVVPSAAHVLAQAGLFEESDKLLKAELPRAVAPYYHMLGLASNAKKRGDKAAALQWYEQAWKKSEGPATKLQWGVSYVNNVVDLAPTDTSRVAASAGAVISALEAKGETFYERNQRSLQRMARKLTDWQGTDAARTKVVAQLKSQLSKTCSKLPAKDAGRTNCEGVFNNEPAG